MRNELNYIKSGIENVRIAFEHTDRFSHEEAMSRLKRAEEYANEALNEYEFMLRQKERSEELGKLKSEAEMYRWSKNSREFYLGWTIFVIIIQTLLIVALVYNARRP